MKKGGGGVSEYAKTGGEPVDFDIRERLEKGCEELGYIHDRGKRWKSDVEIQVDWIDYDYIHNATLSYAKRIQ